MGTFPRLSVAAARRLIFGALTGAGTAKRNAGYFTEAILDTELAGLEGHGYQWLEVYCEHLKCGKVDGRVRPVVKQMTPVSFIVEAKNGFAHPAIEAGFAKLVPAAKRFGIAGMAVHESYNAATLGFHTGYLAKKGLLAFGFTNSVPAMAPVGGRKAVIGTNPMSFAVPAKNGKVAFLIDQSSSAVAWTKVKRAAEAGKNIPLGWALDVDGKPTTNATKGLAGSMAPSGGYKGFAQGLIVETMCAALTGSFRGLQMGSMMDYDSKPVGNGQFFIAIDPRKFSGGLFDKQTAALIKSVTTQKGARMPNAQREANRKRLKKTGLPIDGALLERLKAFDR